MTVLHLSTPLRDRHRKGGLVGSYTLVSKPLFCDTKESAKSGSRPVRQHHVGGFLTTDKGWLMFSMVSRSERLVSGSI